MNQPTIIFLFRYHHGRFELAKRAMDSMRAQTYTKWVVLASYEDVTQLSDLRNLGIYAHIKVEPTKDTECWFNKYLNALKTQVETDSYLMVYDSDSYFHSNTALEELSQHLTNPDELVLCQFIRKGKTKPSNEFMDAKVLKSGKCDFSNLLFHSKHRDLVQIEGNDNSDYFFLKEMTEKLPTKWIKLPVIETDRRSRGI